MCGGEGEGKVVEQQTGALGNPCSSFSSSSSSLCIGWGFDKIFTLGNAVHSETRESHNEKTGPTKSSKFCLSVHTAEYASVKYSAQNVTQSERQRLS